jgi:hypothetical protein
MKSIIQAIFAFSLVALAACDSSDNPAVIDAETFNIQVLHASADAPPVNVLIDGSPVLTDVDYKAGSGQLALAAGSYSIAVEGILPGGNATVIGPVPLDFAADTTYTVVAVGNVADIEPVVFSQPRENPSAGTARLAVLHGAPDAPAVDVYVTTPEAILADSAPVGSFEFKGTIGPAEVAAGDYRIRVTLADDADAVVYDSGTVTLSAGDDFFVTAVPSTNAGSSPISLVLLTGSGSAEIPTSGTPASLRVFHASPDTPSVENTAVDVVVNDNFEQPLVPGLEFSQVAGYVSVAPDTYNVKVTPAGNSGVIPINADLTLAAGEAYDVLAVGTLATLEPLVLNDDPRPVNSYAKVRIVHAAPAEAAASVDIYVTAPGVDINDVDPTLPAVPFKANTGYIPLPANADNATTYVVTVTPAGTKDAAIGPAEFAFFAGDVVTVVAIDALGGGTPLGVIVRADSIIGGDT